MRAARALSLRVVALIATTLVAGCGVRVQDTAEAVATGAPSETQSGNGSQQVGPRLIVFLVRDTTLTAVERRIDAATPATALDLVVDGPTRAEAGTGIQTALAPEVVGVDEVLPDGTTTVSVTRGFTGITGGNQLLAVAQVVWTLTDLPTVERVRFTVEGVPVEVPTDAGLSAGPVNRDDFRSVAPEETTPGVPTTSSPSVGGHGAPSDSPGPR